MMFRCVAKSGLIVCLILSMFATVPLAYAGGSYEDNDMAKDEVLGEEMILDLVLLRPLGLVATVIGTVVFVASLPFTLPMGQMNEAANKLVVKPGKYTFMRPLGYATK